MNLNDFTIVMRKVLFDVRSLVAADPRLYHVHRLTFMKWGQYKSKRNGDINPAEKIVASNTELVIDGYQGSANSFATSAFKHVQRRTVRVAHHLHSPSQVIRAVRLKLPTVVTVREPRDAALSLLRRWPHISASQALRWYIRYYQTLIPYAEEFVVSPFFSTTQKLDDVFREINSRYQTSFELPSYDPETNAQFKGRKEKARADQADMEAVRAMKSRELDELEAKKLLGEAELVYRSFVAAGGKKKFCN
jgi:hypothetical protein